MKGTAGRKRLRAIFTLHRYFIWANRMRDHFDALLMAKTKPKVADPTIEQQLYMSYWYGGLYVVIEGWKRLKLADPTVDDLLRSPNVALLKNYRNGVFHFQPDYDDKRFTKLFAAGPQVVTWVRALNRAFGGYFLRWFEEQRKSKGGA